MNSFLKHATFTVVEIFDNRVFIVDQDIGRTVTNDAEAVVEIMVKAYPGKRIIYRDTDGRWDELVHAKGSFVGFAPYDGYIPQVQQ